MPIPLRQNPVKIVREWRAARRLRAGFVWLTPQLVQGPMFASEQSVLVSRMGIESVLDLREPDGHDASMLAEANLHYYHYPMPEFDPPTLAQLEEGVRWSLAEMAAGRTVLVHRRSRQEQEPVDGLCDPGWTCVLVQYIGDTSTTLCWPAPVRAGTAVASDTPAPGRDAPCCRRPPRPGAVG